MATDTSIIDGQTTIKQNYAAHDVEEFPHNIVFSDKLKLWQKLVRIDVDGTETAIIIPKDIYVEPFYNEEDINTTNTTGKFITADNTYELYSDINGNYKTIESEYICWQRDRDISTVNMTVFAEDDSGDVSTNYTTYIYNGSIWIATADGFPITFIDYNSASLDANLDADLGGQLSNQDAADARTFQNKLKFKLIKNSTDKLIVKRIIIKVTWKQAWTSAIYGV